MELLPICFASINVWKPPCLKKGCFIRRGSMPCQKFFDFSDFFCIVLRVIKGAANVILSILLTNFYNQAATVGCVVVFIFHPDHGYFKQRDRASKVEDHYVNLVSHPIMTFCQLFYFQKSHLNILQ